MSAEARLSSFLAGQRHQGRLLAFEAVIARDQSMRSLGITAKLTLVFVTFAALLLAVLGTISFVSGRNALEAAAESEVLQAAIEKEAALGAWFEDRLSSTVALAESPSISLLAEAVLSLPEETAGRSQVRSRQIQDRFLSELRNWVGPGQIFDSILFIEPSRGRVILGTTPGEKNRLKEGQPYFIQGRTRPFIQGPYYSADVYGPVVTIAAPVQGANGQLLGVLAGHVNIGEIGVVVARRTDFRETADAYLVDRQYLLVTQPRFAKDDVILRVREPSEAVRRCLTGDRGVIQAPDYRDVPAIVAYRWIPERNLCLIVKVDRAEALAPATAFGRTILRISGMTLLVASVLGLGLAGTITRRVRALQGGVERFSRGRLDVRVPDTSADELGMLARAFNAMAQTLNEIETQLLENTAQLERANRAKSEFLSRMSHELRTPMNAILGFAQLLEMDTLNTGQRECVEEILKGGQHLLALINEVLDIARIEADRVALSMEPVHVGKVVEDVVNLIRPLAAQRRLQLTVTPEACSLYVMADAQRLRQVLLNLLSNAVKYNHEGGDVAIVCAEVGGRRLRISVADTGPGIPPDGLARLFTPFERLGADLSRVEGTGVGLALAKGLVELMDGEIGVESVVGKGSTFWVEFPMPEAEANRIRKEQARLAPSSDDLAAS